MYVIFIILLFVRICYKINRNGFFIYMSTFWNVFELLLISVGVFSVLVYIIHLKESSAYVEQFQREGLDQFFFFKKLIFFFVIAKVLLVLLFLVSIFRIFISWNFGNSYFFFYKTLALSKPILFLVGILFIIYFFTLWRTVGYVINVFIFPHYKTTILPIKGFRLVVSNNSSFRALSTTIFLFFVIGVFHIICFLLFFYFYRISKHSKPNPLTFNYFSFVFSECKRKYKKCKKGTKGTEKGTKEQYLEHRPRKPGFQLK